MKTVIIKEVLRQVAGDPQNRYATFRTVLVKRLINERTGASQQSDSSSVTPYQAMPSAGSMRRARMIYEYKVLLFSKLQLF
jgi:hypothetical protein